MVLSSRGRHFCPAGTSSTFQYRKTVGPCRQVYWPVDSSNWLEVGSLHSLSRWKGNGNIAAMAILPHTSTDSSDFEAKCVSFISFFDDFFVGKKLKTDNFSFEKHPFGDINMTSIRSCHSCSYAIDTRGSIPSSPSPSSKPLK